MEQTRRTFEAAAAELAATLQDSKRARAVAYGLRSQPAPATAPSPHTQQPAPSTHRAGPQEESREHPGRTTQP
ncbi:hypothetical protein [Streptomyces sp. NPDC006334]|uniref:hypothetical protein n=1 Tax=Streptomyces sp. NPDC006334 TaxID=3156754 RepID=UPI0033AD7CD6